MKKQCDFSVAFLLAVILGAVTAAAATGSKSSGINSKIKLLISRLASNTYSSRFNARQNLAAIGKAALPALQAALDNANSPVLRRRIRQTVFQINYQIIQRGTLISIMANNEPLAQILRQVERETGGAFHVRLSPAAGAMAGQRFSLDMQHQPVLKVVQTIAHNAGLLIADPEHVPGTLVLFPSLHDDALRIGPRDPVQDDGAFLISAHTAFVDRPLGSPATAPAGKHLVVYLTLLVDPGAHLAGFPSPPAITEVVDNRGRGRAWPFNHPWPNAFYSTAGEFFEFQRPIRQWPDKANILRVLRGGMPVRVCVTSTRVVFPTPFSGGKSVVDGVRLRLGEMYAQDNMFIVRLHYHVPRDGNVPLPSEAAQSVVDSFNGLNYPQLMDPAGQLFKPAGYKGKLNMRKGYFQYFYKPITAAGRKIAARPSKMVVRVYQSIRVIRLPFMFRNVALPVQK